ncbi:MAG: RrF2 family transcriptional regulator [bacterium]
MAELFNAPDAARIGLHAALILARQPEERWTINHLAQTLNVSAAHLAKVLARLEQAGIVNGKTGPAGGYTIARPARETSLWTVYQAVVGEVNIKHCPFAVPVCEGGCPLGNFFVQTSRRLAKYLKTTSLADVQLKLNWRRNEKDQKNHPH